MTLVTYQACTAAVLEEDETDAGTSTEFQRLLSPFRRKRLCYSLIEQDGHVQGLVHLYPTVFERKTEINGVVYLSVQNLVRIFVL